MLIAAVPLATIPTVPVNWFDAVVVLVLGAGLFRGRKNGMSKEVIPLFQWLALVIIAGLGYKIVAQTFMNAAGMGKTSSYLIGYLVLALGVYLIFSLLHRTLTKRVETSNYFGAREFYFGMPAGMIRFGCMLLAVLALLNAPFYTSAEIKAQRIKDENDFGGGLWSGNYFPHIYTLQRQVFKESLSGPFVKKYLGAMLVSTVAPGSAEAGKGGHGGPPPAKQSGIYIGNMK